MSMRIAALLTSRITEALAQLPAVPTSDWSDRAAAGLTLLHPSSAAAVVLVQVDHRGYLNRVHLTGAARGSGETPPSGAAAPDPALAALHEAFVPGEWIGWNFGEIGPGRVAVRTSAHMHGFRRPDNAVWRRWSAFAPVEVVAGIAPVHGSGPGESVIVEVALQQYGANPAEEGERCGVVLEAVLPLLAARAARAMNLRDGGRVEWLTPKEELVLWHLLGGMKVPEIAQRIGRSVYTVHDHVKSLHTKLGATNRGQLVARALGHLGPEGETPSGPPLR